MEVDGFTHFHAPARNIHGSWFIRSVDTNMAGNYFYLAFDMPTRPYITTRNNPPATILTDSHIRALEEYDYYYAYHGGLKASSPVPPKIVESEVMDF